MNPNDYLTPDKWDLDFYKPEDLLGRDPDAQWVSRRAALGANEAAKAFHAETGIRVGVNLAEGVGPNGEGTRRGTRSPGNNPGVKGSRHLHGDAFDFQVQNLDDDQKVAFMKHLRRQGFVGYGFYTPEEGGHLHADMGRPRTWAKNGVPKWGALALRDDPAFNKQEIPYEVGTAIDHMASKFGVDRKLAHAMAYAESSYDPQKTVGTSSAVGLYQMTKSNWKYLVDKYGSQHADIGAWDRTNPLHNAIMMGHSIKENQELFKKRFGRDPDVGEIYGSHFLGASGFSRFRSFVATNPDAPAYQGVSEAAAASNHSVFFDKKGRARTAGEVFDWMYRKAGNAPGYEGRDLKARSLAVYAGLTTQGDMSEKGKQGILQSHGMKPDIVNQTAAERDAAERKLARKNSAQSGVSATTAQPGLGYNKLDYNATMAPPPVTTKDLAAAEEARMKHREETAPMAGQLFGDAVNTTHVFPWLMSGAPHLMPDPNFKLDMDMANKLTEGIEPRYHKMVLDSFSLDQALAAREDALYYQGADKRLNEAGGVGVGLRLGAAFIDPAMWAVGIGGGAAINAGMRTAGGAATYSRLTAGLANSALAGASVGLEQAAGNPNITMQDYVVSSLLGFGLGAMIGPGAKTAERALFAKTMADAAQEARMAKALQIEAGKAAGAAQNLEAKFEPFMDEAFSRLRNQDVPEGAGANKLSYGAAERLAISKNPVARLAGQLMGENAIGMKGHRVVPHAASERAKLIEESGNYAFDQVFIPSYRKWAEEEGLTWYNRSKKVGQFSDTVTKYVRETDPAKAALFNEHVRTVGDEIKRLQKQLAELARNPGMREGKDFRSVKGAEFIPDNQNYMLRMWDTVGLRKLGRPKLEILLRGAIRDAQPTLDVKYLNRLVQGAADNMMSRAHGANDVFERAMMGYDDDALRAVLRAAGAGDEEIEDAVKALTKPKTSDSGRSSRLKHRMFLNEKFKMKIDDVEHNLEDYLVNDAVALFRSYNRQMAGRIGMAQTRLFNPETKELLMDGITSDADFEKLVSQMKKSGVTAGQSAREIATDEQNLRFMYDFINGRLSMPDNGWMDALRLVQKYNFTRLMGQVGFAQIPEAATTVGAMGWRASLEHMPELRRILAMSPKEIEAHGVMDDFEAILGAPTSMMRSHIVSRYDDEATNSFRSFERGTVADKAEAGLENANRVVSRLSGMAGVTDMLKNWSMKVVGQKFVNLATGAKVGPDGRLVITGANRRRLQAVGIDDTAVEKYRYRNPEYKSVDAHKMMQDYRETVAAEQARTATRMSKEDLKLYESNMESLKDISKNSDVIDERYLPQIDAIRKETDELLTKYGYKPPKLPTKGDVPAWIEGEGTMLERIVRQIKDHAKTTTGTLNEKKFQVMNFNSWTDLEAREAFLLSLRRFSNRLVQENDVGQMHRWMSHPVARVVTQFRTFTMAAWSKQLLHNWHMAFGDGMDRQNAMALFNYFMTSVVMGGAVYAVQEKLRNAGRSDGEERYQKRIYGEEGKRLFEYQPLVTAAIQRAGWSSLIPLMVDSSGLSHALAGDPLFDARTTGQATDALFGNPTFGMVDSIRKLPILVGDMSREGRGPTQADLRNAQSLLPFQNLMGIQQALSYLMSDLPERKRQ